MRLIPARRARRRTEPLVIPRTLSRNTFLARLPDVTAFASPDFFPLAMMVDESRFLRAIKLRHAHNTLRSTLIAATQIAHSGTHWIPVSEASSLVHATRAASL